MSAGGNGVKEEEEEERERERERERVRSAVGSGVPCVRARALNPKP